MDKNTMSEIVRKHSTDSMVPVMLAHVYDNDKMFFNMIQDLVNRFLIPSSNNLFEAMHNLAFDFNLTLELIEKEDDEYRALLNGNEIIFTDETPWNDLVEIAKDEYLKNNG